MRDALRQGDAAHHGMKQNVSGSLTIRWQPRVRVVTSRTRSRSSRHEGALHGREVNSRMPATVHSIAEPEPDAEKSAVTLHYEAMLAGLNAQLTEKDKDLDAGGRFDALRIYCNLLRQRWW
jgi:hypothetical protein